MSVARAQAEIDAAEFRDWVTYLRDRPPMVEQMAAYLAQVAQVVMGSCGIRSSLQDNLLRFGSQADDLTPEEFEELTDGQHTNQG